MLSFLVSQLHSDMFLNSIDVASVQVTDCIWHQPRPVDAYTHLRLLKNGWKSHSYKTSFAKHSSGGSTGWKFCIDNANTYSIEIYTSSRSCPGTRRLGMNWQEYENRILNPSDLSNFRYVHPSDDESPTSPAHESILACDFKTTLGCVTLHIIVPVSSPNLHDHLHIASTLTTVPVGGILCAVEKLEPLFEPFSMAADIASEIHPIVKGIVGSFRAVHHVLKGISQLNKEIYSLLEEMCAMLRHLDKLRSCIKVGSETEDLRLLLLKMESVMKHTCDFVQVWHDSKKKKGALLTSLSREQTLGIKKLQAQFLDVKSDLDRGIAVETFVRTRILSDKLGSLPFPSLECVSTKMPDDPPAYDSWGVNRRVIQS
ncbi:hypothetical protein D9758_015182 [Tetrapyrgos nigripes]|uniref:Uncharacterized protein n=1 Tax=Tetrapyrgos nigripes TaxID=182062 RepID=A0A8H5C108_9AGAR|nr:hypothetical protein D9758_015182 [Tetrapyrgos nigripes]